MTFIIALLILLLMNLLLMRATEKNLREAHAILNECKSWVNYYEKMIEEERG